MNSTELPATRAGRGAASEQLREQAITLRRAGHSRREIKALLGITSNATLDKALRGEPPPEWTRRPNAKDEVRARARELREGGLNYDEIAGALGVSKSSVSLWVRDMPRPPRLSYWETRKRAAEGVRRYWAAERPAREARREVVRAAAAANHAQAAQPTHHPQERRPRLSRVPHRLRPAERRPVRANRGLGARGNRGHACAVRPIVTVTSRTRVRLPGEDSNLGSRLQRSLSCQTRRPGIASSRNSTGLQVTSARARTTLLQPATAREGGLRSAARLVS